MPTDIFANAPQPIARWHDYMESRDPAVLDALLDDAVIFESPVVHTPQEGKAITLKYLSAAAIVLGNPSFTYLDAWYGERSAVLEFACDLDGIKINGVDMISWNPDGRVVGFKVMVRPLKAINALHAMMGAELMKGAPKAG